MRMSQIRPWRSVRKKKLCSFWGHSCPKDKEKRTKATGVFTLPSQLLYSITLVLFPSLEVISIFTNYDVTLSLLYRLHQKWGRQVKVNKLLSHLTELFHFFLAPTSPVQVPVTRLRLCLITSHCAEKEFSYYWNFPLLWGEHMANLSEQWK